MLASLIGLSYFAYANLGTAAPLTVAYDGVTPGTGCSIPMDIEYCWANSGEAGYIRTERWVMNPSDTEFDPINEGIEPDGEFSPGTDFPIISVTIGGVRLDASNPCGCFNYNGCCFEFCNNGNSMSIIYYDCDGTHPCVGAEHNF